MATWSGGFGSRVAAHALFVALVFVGCGGESETNRRGGGNGDDDSGSGGTSSGGSNGNRGGVSGDGSGGIAGTSGVGMSGSSFCGGKPCDPPYACCLATSECFDPRTDEAACPTPDPDGDPQGRKTCTSNAHCELGEYCSLDAPRCFGTGHCQPTNNCGGCLDPAVPNPACRVCGCDGNTYPDPEAACNAGVNALYLGLGCGDTGMEGGAGASSIPMRPFVACGHDAQCPSGSFCCALAGRCYLEADRDICVLPPPGTRIACNRTEQCGDREYCRGEGCDGPGGCVNFDSGPGDCGVLFEPVCGCDGKTYTSAACADREGIRVDHTGECEGAGG